MEEDEFWEEPEEYADDYVDLEDSDDEELFDDFGEDGSYGDEDY